MITASDLELRAGSRILLSGTSLRVQPGDRIGLVGRNGAGKTTLFNVVCGFTRPDEGTLRWRGDTLKGLRPHQLAGLGISRTLQGVGLFAGLTVLENVHINRVQRHDPVDVDHFRLAVSSGSTDGLRHGGIVSVLGVFEQW